jgi:two-component system response regulator NreC
VTTNNHTVLHIEDDSLWQSAVSAALGGINGIGRVARATDRASALVQLDQLRPDLVLLDLMLPDADGMAFALELAQTRHQTRILILSVRRDPVVLHTAHTAQIAGLLWKTADVFTELPAAVTTVLAGGRYYPAEVRAALRRFRADPQAFFKILSPRELGLMPYFGRGWADDEIARAVGLSDQTVRSHRHHIMRKLDLPSAARLTHWAIQAGFAAPFAAREDGTRYG